MAPFAALAAAPEALVVNTLTTAVVFAKDYYEARTGTSLFTGETLSPSEQAMSALSASLSGMMPALAVVKSAQKFTASVRALGEIFAGERADSAAINAVQKAEKIVDSAKPFTERLTAGKIRDYLSKVDTIPREGLIADIESVGLKLKGNDRTRPFLEFVDREGRVRAKLHPPDKATEYHHLHIYDKDSNPMTSALEVIAGKKGYKSPDAHIEIMEP